MYCVIQRKIHHRIRTPLSHILSPTLWPIPVHDLVSCLQENGSPQLPPAPLFPLSLQRSADVEPPLTLWVPPSVTPSCQTLSFSPNLCTHERRGNVVASWDNRVVLPVFTAMTTPPHALFLALPFTLPPRQLLLPPRHPMNHTPSTRSGRSMSHMGHG